MARRYLTEKEIKEKRQQIMNTALKVFSRQGYGESTMSDIAMEAGIAIGTIYNYFENKREILISIIEEWFFNQSLGHVLGMMDNSDEISIISNLYFDRLGLISGDMDKFLFILGEVQRSDDIREQYRQRILNPMLGKFEEYLNRKMGLGVQAPVIARAIAGMGLGFALIHFLERDKNPVAEWNRMELSKLLATLVVDGLRVFSSGGDDTLTSENENLN